MALLLIFFRLMLVSCTYLDHDQYPVAAAMCHGQAGISADPTYRACVDLEDEAILVGEECCSTEGGAVGVHLDS